jgi:hypothetical protein
MADEGFLDGRFLALAVLISVLGTSTYIRATLAGQTRPNRVTWFLWGLAPLIVFAAQMGEQVGLTAVMTLVAGVSPLLVLAASFANRDAYWAVTARDLACASLSVLALGAWLVTRTGALAIALALAADLAAGVPTLVKAYRQPETESPTAFATAAVAAMITLLCLPAWTFAATAFPLFLMAMASTLFLLVRFPGVRPPGARRPALAAAGAAAVVTE